MVFRKTVFIKMFINLTIVLILFGVIVAGGTQLFLAGENTRRMIDMVESAAVEGRDVLGEDQNELPAKIRRIARISNTIVVVWDNDGEVLVDTSGSTFDVRALVRENRIKADRGIDIYNYRGELENVEVHYILAQGEAGGKTIQVLISTQNVSGLVSSASRLTRWFVFAAFAVGLIWSFVYSRWSTLPISEMNRVTKEMANLDFSHKIEANSNDEVGELAYSINELSDKLSGALEELHHKNTLLTAELARERSLDTMRKKFVSDVSHELKTPLSIIQGYAEALEMKADKNDKTAKYSRAIMDETQRMTKLVHDLLNLSNYQSGNYVLKRREFSIDGLIEHIVETHTHLAAEKGITVKTQVAPYTVNGDPDRLEQVVVNLLSNALSHADGKKKVLIAGNASDKGYVVRIVNTGDPIPDNEMDKLWTPFYRHDNSRKRDQDRYGIGLSIVKALLDLHGADFGVKNVADGVEFWFELYNVPVAPEQTVMPLPDASEEQKDENLPGDSA